MGSEGNFLAEGPTLRPSKLSVMEGGVWTGGSKGEDCACVEMPPVVDNMRWVIFPGNRWIMIWDSVILVLLCYLAFVIPYMVGISGGYRLLFNVPWLILNVLINTVFVVDTVLYFFRAYRDQNDRLVFNLRRIRQRYFKTFFVPNMLSSLPSTLIFYYYGRLFVLEHGSVQSEASMSILFKLFDLVKLVRILRVSGIISRSDLITDLRQKNKSYLLQMIKFVLLIILTSHLFACIWCFVAYVQLDSFAGDHMASTSNWISYWYENNYQPGGLDPIGWTEDLDRYVLSLFWAIQTITSIGYGNIVPVTPVEWWVGSILQLTAGVMWAYVIGGLVGVVASIDGVDEEYRMRIDGANDLIKQFSQDHTGGPGDSRDRRRDDERKLAARSIRRYLSNQKRKSSNAGFSSRLGERYPVIESLSPQMQRISIFLVARDHLEAVPFISSRFLSNTEQSFVAEECVFLNFPAGERIEFTEGVENLGRGTLLLTEGIATCFVKKSMKKRIWRKVMIGGDAVGDDEVLLEDGAVAITHVMHFLTYTKVLFIPRHAIMAALLRNPRAWKECARWKYLKALLLWGNVSQPKDKECTPNNTRAF